MLYTSWLFQNVVPPVLSFSLGSLGFLTKFDFADHPKTLARMFGEDGVTVGLRVRFEGVFTPAPLLPPIHADSAQEQLCAPSPKAKGKEKRENAVSARSCWSLIIQIPTGRTAQ